MRYQSYFEERFKTLESPCSFKDDPATIEALVKFKYLGYITDDSDSNDEFEKEANLITTVNRDESNNDDGDDDTNIARN